jgi:hypothetical protein
MTPTTITRNPAVVLAKATSQTQQRINAVHKILDNCGYVMSPSKVNRIVRQFEHQAERNGWNLLDFIANKIALTEQQRHQVLADPDVARVISYADPTGESAVRNVMAVAHA